MLRDLSKKKKIKNMNRKMTTHAKLSTTEPLKKKGKTNKNTLSKQLEQEQNHRNGDHTEGYQWGRGRDGEKVQ